MFGGYLISGRYSRALEWEDADYLESAIEQYLKLYYPPPPSIERVVMLRCVSWIVGICLLIGIIVAVGEWISGYQGNPVVGVCQYFIVSFLCLGIPVLIFIGSFFYSSPSRLVPDNLAYRALATMGLVRCYVTLVREREARAYAARLAAYPVDSVKYTGEASLCFLDGNLQGAVYYLKLAKNRPQLWGDIRSIYLDGLERCGRVFKERVKDFTPEDRFVPMKEIEEELKKRPQKKVYHVHHEELVQNIEEYIMGNKVTLTDCIVNRSRIGGGGDQPIDVSRKEEVLARYKQMLESAREDGVLSEQEFYFLKRVREQEGITPAEHLQALEEVIQLMKKKNYPCPECGEWMEYSEEDDGWYCPECEEYVLKS